MAPPEIEEQSGSSSGATGDSGRAPPAGAAAPSATTPGPPQKLSLLLHQAIVIFAACVQMAITSSQVGADKLELQALRVRHRLLMHVSQARAGSAPPLLKQPAARRAPALLCWLQWRRMQALGRLQTVGLILMSGAVAVFAIAFPSSFYRHRSGLGPPRAQCLPAGLHSTAVSQNGCTWSLPWQRQTPPSARDS